MTGEQGYRISFYICAGLATLFAASPMYQMTVWFALMSAVAFARGRMWE